MTQEIKAATELLRVTFYLTVWVSFFLRGQHRWQKQRMLGEHHVDHWKLDELGVHGALGAIQELCGSTEGL